MDALKSAGRAIIKSPGVPRQSWGTSKHENHTGTLKVKADSIVFEKQIEFMESETSLELPENWTDTKETLLEGMVFSLKYLGMTLVGQPKGEDMASAAIRRIVSMARAGAKKFRKVTLTVSPKGIIISDTETGQLIENVSIYRISYCTADKTQDKVFAYVSQSQFSETLECHAFLCPKKKIAQAVTLTVAQAFKVALDLWEISQEDKNKEVHSCCSPSDCPVDRTERSPHCSPGSGKLQSLRREKKLSKSFFSSVFLSPSPCSRPKQRQPIKQDSWDVEDGLEDAFLSSVDAEVMETEWQSPAPECAMRMQL